MNKKLIKKEMERLSKDKKVYFIGYNLKFGSRNYGILKDIDKNKLLEMPVAENLMTGIAIGMALEGLKPVLIFERHDFMLNAFDQLINHLHKIPKISNFNPKVMIRAKVGHTKPFNPGPQHTQDFTWILKKFFPIEINPKKYKFDKTKIIIEK